jgi:uncharacterized protein (TIGR03085 family)
MGHHTNWARQERHELSDLLEELGPNHPTLCEGWTTADLAAHLVIRERRPDAAIGLIVSAFAGHTNSVMSSVKALPWSELVGQVRQGPPRWNPFAIPAIDAVANTLEFFVHHEDVRRTVDGWQPRVLDAAFDALMWSRLKAMAPLLWRKAQVGVTLHNGVNHIVAKKTPLEPRVVATGAVGELVLKSYGRNAVVLELLGEPESIESFNSTPLGL